MQCLRKYKWVKLPPDYPNMSGPHASLCKAGISRCISKRQCRLLRLQQAFNPQNTDRRGGGILSVKIRAKALQVLQKSETRVV